MPLKYVTCSVQQHAQHSPCHLLTWSYHPASSDEPWFISDYGIPPHSYISFWWSWQQPKQAWQWRAGIAGITGFLAAFLAWSLAMCSLFLTIWSEICLWYRCAHLDCKSLETYSSAMKQGWVPLGCFLPSRLNFAVGLWHQSHRTWSWVWKWYQDWLQIWLRLWVPEHQLPVAWYY